MPSEPVSIAATSESMSPNKLSVTITSNCSRPAYQLHAERVGELVVEFDIPCSRGHAGALTGLEPQDARLHHVALVGRGHDVAAGPGQFEGDARDPLDLERVVDLRVDAAPLAVAEIDDLLRLAEIDPRR